eukprot:TRINITY_DN47094_c0_g1_i1.p1 TRINITY_DN47094_c0_g1~~TRINITY_DN47094_c0_g1_i1.p1  ORF type:complete len:458 (+),score=166.15 TRINITY_DN47094_c0_g1_i1:59-1375(+)
MRSAALLAGALQASAWTLRRPEGSTSVPADANLPVPPPAATPYGGTAGYIQTDPQYNSHLFFWHFEPRSGRKDAPLLVWLQGGPGSSSMVGLFQEHGPLQLSEESQVVPREVSWANDFHVMYVDNPAGTGYSFTNDTRGYATKQSDVAKGMVAFLGGFYSLYPAMRKLDLILCGESMAGKYVPSVTHGILEHNKGLAPSDPARIPLVAFSLGNAVVHPPAQLTIYSDWAVNAGLLDAAQGVVQAQLQSNCSRTIAAQDWPAAADCFNGLPDSILAATGSSWPYDLRRTQAPEQADLAAFLNRTDVRAKVNAGGHSYVGTDSPTVYKYMYDDFGKSVLEHVDEAIAAGLRVLLYNGVMDVLVPPVSTEAYIRQLTWSGVAAFEAAARAPFKANGTVGGFRRSHGKLTHASIRNAGHLAPGDNPHGCLAMITEWVQSDSL